jgi:hypothetical protein
MLSRTSRWQRNLVMRPGIWANCHKSLFGELHSFSVTNYSR